MPGLATIEAPRLEVGYEQLSPDIHRALERIVGQRSDGSFRVDGVGLEDLDTMQQILHGAQGNHLPRHIFDEHGNYVPVSRTPIVEERHTRVFALEPLSGQSEEKCLWLRVPRYSEEPESEPEISQSHRRLTDKQFLLALGSTGLAADAMFITGLVTEKAGFFAGFVAAGGAMAVAAFRRIRQ